MQNKRRELRKKLNEICRNILKATDEKQIKQLHADRKRMEAKIQRSEGGPVESTGTKKSRKYIGSCPLCSYRIKYGESYVEYRKMTFCNERHYKEYVALRNEK